MEQNFFSSNHNMYLENMNEVITWTYLVQVEWPKNIHMQKYMWKLSNSPVEVSICIKWKAKLSEFKVYLCLHLELKVCLMNTKIFAIWLSINKDGKKFGPIFILELCAVRNISILFSVGLKFPLAVFWNWIGYAKRIV